MNKGFRKLEMWRSARKYLILVLPLFFAIFSFNNVSAAMTSEADLYKKSLLMGVKTCYEMYAKDSIQIKDFEDYLSVFNKNSGFANVSSSDIWITTHVGNSLNTSYYNDSNFSCKQVFEGYGSSARGLKDFYTMPTTLEGMGYQFSSVTLDGDDGNVAENGIQQITFSIGSVTDDTSSNQNPVTITGGGISCNFVKKTNAWIVTECNGETGISYNGEQLMNLVGNGSENLTIETGPSVSMTAVTADMLNISLYEIEVEKVYRTLKSSFDVSVFTSNLKSLVGDVVRDIYVSPSVKIESSVLNWNTAENQNATYIPIGNSKTKAKNKFITTIGASSESFWTVNDQYSLYYRYLLDIKKNYPEMSINQCSAEKPANGYAFKNSPTEWCIISMPPSETGAKSETMSIFNVNTGLKEGTFESVLSWLSNENNYANVSEDTYANASVDENGNLVPGDSEDGSTEEVTCLSSGAAGSLGWIVCSLIDWFGDVAQDFYTNAIEDNLQVDPILFTGGDGGTKQAWETFRTIANIAFIVVFLAVIFSQLTGVGIDNYGIKKILPKLIVAAILINLSYWLCVALVDVSNILGYSLQRMFNGLAENLKVVSSVIPGSTVLPTLASVAILGILAGSAIWSGGAIVFTLLISALGVVVSIAFLFVLLSVRQAAIVVLVATSPLAVIAYILPNAKKTLFDKWWKFLKSQLLVYPIIGLLVGGGNYVSKLLLASGIGDQGVFSAATAMITGVAPIFFIPTVLKNSMAAMGTLGTKLSGMGRTASGWATKKATNSELNKNAQKMGLERKTRKKAGYNANGELTSIGEMKARFARTGIGRFVGSDKRLAMAQNAAKKNIGVQEEANVILANSLARAGIAKGGGDPNGYYKQLFLDASQRGDEVGMNAAIAAAVSSGYMKDKDIAKMVRDAENNGNIRFKDTASRAAWLRDTATKYGNGFLATDAELKTFMQKGGDSALGDYGAYAAAGGVGIDDLKPEDIPKLSGDSLAGLIASGVLTQGMARRILASNPNISEDKKIMLSARAEGANVTDAGRFKEEAKALMENHSATGVTDGNGAITAFTQITGTDAATIDRWTANNPMDTNITNDVLNTNANITNDVLNTNANITNDVLDVHETVRNYQDAQGNVYEVQHSRGGQHTDQGGFDVQIDPTGQNGLKPM